MKSKIIGLVIGVLVLGGLMVNTLLEAPVVTETATTTVNTEIASSTIPEAKTEIKIENKEIQTSVNVPDTPKPTVIPPTEPTQKTQFAFAEVSIHNNKNDCWSIVNNNVYELTSWISKHPGGEREIISMCGKDAASAFDDQHGGESKPEKILASYYIGTLIN